MGFRSHVAGSIDLNLEELIDRKTLRFMGNAAAYAFLSMEQAIKDHDSKRHDIQILPDTFMTPNKPRTQLNNKTPAITYSDIYHSTPQYDADIMNTKKPTTDTKSPNRISHLISKFNVFNPLHANNKADHKVIPVVFEDPDTGRLSMSPRRTRSSKKFKEIMGFS